MKSLGIPGVILFGLPETKDEVATGAWADDGIVQKATRAIKREVPGLLLMGDVCLCEYMSHGHCGLVDTSDPNAKARARSHGVHPRAGVEGQGCYQSRHAVAGRCHRCGHRQSPRLRPKSTRS